MLANKIPVMGLILVTGVFQPFQISFLELPAQRVHGKFKQRPCQYARTKCSCFRHARKPVHTAAADQVEQQGLRLGIPVMCSQKKFIFVQNVLDNFISQAPGFRFEA